MRLAPLKRRLLSLIYEALILAALLLAVTLPIVMLTRGLDHAPARLVLQCGLTACCGLFYAAQWRGAGQTLPMKTWRLHLRLANGDALDTRRALMRYGAALLGTLALGAGFWWALADRDRQFLHDRLCGTRIFQADPPAAPAP